MDERPEIHDYESLEAWLRGRPREDAVLIAHRAAMRVAPLWFAAMDQEWAREVDLNPLAVLRSNLTSGVDVKFPIPEVWSAHAAATAAATDHAFAAADAAAAAAAASASVHAAHAAADAAAAFGPAAHAAADAAAAAFGPAAAAEATADAVTAAAILWKSVEKDLHGLLSDGSGPEARLWMGENPFANTWQDSIPILRDTPGGDFWIDWYQRALDGRPQNWDLLRDVALIDNGLWKQGGEALDAEIGRLVTKYGPDGGTALSKASPVDFDFDRHLQQMQIVGFADDITHLDDPQAIAAFAGDAEELQDSLQDFLDYSVDAARATNRQLRSAMAAEKLWKELERCKTGQSIRARRLIMLGKTFADLALDDAERATLGEGVTNILDDSVSLLRTIYRKHLGPSLERMRPLITLELGEEDPDELLKAAERLAELMEGADNKELARLSPEAMAVIEDFVQELRQQRGALADASSSERRDALRKRFAEVYGSVAVAYGRYVEKGKPYVENAAKGADWLIKQYKRWTTFEQIAETIRDCPCKGLL